MKRKKRRGEEKYRKMLILMSHVRREKEIIKKTG